MFVSVYLPTCNRKASLQKAIESVLRQTFTQWELIVVDDASEDGTPDLLQKFAASESRVRFFRNEQPGGAPKARNRAIAAAIGDFITGLDDDDTFHPDRLAALCEYWRILTRNGDRISGIYTQESWQVNGREISQTYKSGRVDFKSLAKSNGIGNQLFSPRSHYIEVGMFDEAMPAWQDLELFMRMTKRFGEARLLDATLYNFDVTPSEGRISSKEARVRAAYQRVIERHFPDDRLSQQKLMLQVFSPYYGFKPKTSDIVDFVRRGLWLRGLVDIAKTVVR